MNTDRYEDLEACPPPAHGRAASAVNINGSDKIVFLVSEFSEIHKRDSHMLSRMRQLISSSINETRTAFTCHEICHIALLQGLSSHYRLCASIP